MASLLTHCLGFLALFLQCLSIHVRTQPLPPPPFNITTHDLLNYLSLENLTNTPPAIYVFGDTYIDSGNNNFLNTIAKGNYSPYGVDFGGLPPTGRFTNGRTAPDFIAQVVGLPFPPPVLKFSRAEKRTLPLTGLNFGSGFSGILPMPPTLAASVGQILSFEAQIKKFKKTVASLKTQFDSRESFALYMSKSLFFIHIGSNDLGIYWELENFRKFDNNATEYALMLSKKLSHGLEAIYRLGARKFLISNVSPLGCQPFSLNTYNHTGSCVEDINQRTSLYNGVLPNMLTNLEASLKVSTLVLCDLYKVFEDVYAQPAAYGFTNVNASCCIDEARNGTRECARGFAPCLDRTSHLFFDPFHQTESMNFLWISRFLKDDSLCSPINLFQLIQF